MAALVSKSRRVKKRLRLSGAAQGFGSSEAVVGAILPIIPKMLDFQLSGLADQGIGRYGLGQLPDVTYGADGSTHPITEYQILAGVIGHPTPSLDLYGYAGLEHADRWSQTVGGVNYGYGNPNASNAGCATEGSALSCTANTPT